MSKTPKTRRRRSTADIVATLKEAVALEEAGGTWNQSHAAAVAGYSVAYLRNSDCPKHFEEGNGPKGKARVVYIPAEVRQWKRSLLISTEQKAG